MNDIEIQQADEEVIEFIALIEEDNQTNKQKYETIKPFFDRLNLYCDEFSLKFEKDTDLFSIPLDAITGAIYEEECDVLFLLFKKNRSLHAFNMESRVHIIYVIPKKHNPFIFFFLKLYNRIRINIIMYRLKNKFKNYIKEKIKSINQK